MDSASALSQRVWAQRLHTRRPTTPGPQSKSTIGSAIFPIHARLTVPSRQYAAKYTTQVPSNSHDTALCAKNRPGGLTSPKSLGRGLRAGVGAKSIRLPDLSPKAVKLHVAGNQSPERADHVGNDYRDVPDDRFPIHSDSRRESNGSRRRSPRPIGKDHEQSH